MGNGDNDMLNNFMDDYPLEGLYWRMESITLFLDRLLNPVLGKSTVLYLRKDRNNPPGSPEDMVPESKAKTAKGDGKIPPI